MASVLNISNISGGTPPYSFYVCDENGNNCSLLGTTASAYTLNAFYSTANTLLIKVIDSNSCQFFTLISCPIDSCIILTEDLDKITTEDGDFIVFCDF